MVVTPAVALVVTVGSENSAPLAALLAPWVHSPDRPRALLQVLYSPISLIILASFFLIKNKRFRVCPTPKPIL